MPILMTEEQGFVFLYINYTKNAFVDTLRKIFGSSSTPEKYRYDADTNKSQLSIRSDFAQRIVKSPEIVVRVIGGNADVTYLGDEILRETTAANDGVDGYLYGGKLELNVTMEISGGTMRDTEHLTDLVAIYTRYLFRQKFAESNIAYLSVKVGDIAEDGENFKCDVSTVTTSEFTHIIPKDLYDLVQGLTFDIGTYF